MGIYNSNRHAGPCWSRDKGYHRPARSPFPDHITRIVRAPSPVSEDEAERVAAKKGYPIAASVKLDRA